MLYLWWAWHFAYIWNNTLSFDSSSDLGNATNLSKSCLLYFAVQVFWREILWLSAYFLLCLRNSKSYSFEEELDQISSFLWKEFIFQASFWLPIMMIYGLVGLKIDLYYSYTLIFCWVLQRKTESISLFFRFMGAYQW